MSFFNRFGCTRFDASVFVRRSIGNDGGDENPEVQLTGVVLAHYHKAWNADSGKISHSRNWSRLPRPSQSTDQSQASDLSSGSHTRSLSPVNSVSVCQLHLLFRHGGNGRSRGPLTLRDVFFFFTRLYHSVTVTADTRRTHRVGKRRQSPASAATRWTSFWELALECYNKWKLHYLAGP